MDGMLELSEFQVLSKDDLSEIDGGVANSLLWVAVGAVAEYACQEIFDKSLGEVIVDAAVTVLTAPIRANEQYFETFHNNESN